MGPDQQVGVTQSQLLSPWLQSGAFAQANPLTMPIWGQAAAAQPQPQAVWVSEHTAAAWHAPLPPVYYSKLQFTTVYYSNYSVPGCVTAPAGPYFQQAAAAASATANAAALRIMPLDGGKKLRDHAAGKGSNIGTDSGAAGVA